MTIPYLHVIHSLDPRSGGPAESVKQLSHATARMRRSVEIVTFDSPGQSWSGDFNVPVHYLGPSYLNYGYAPAFYQWLRRNAGRFSAVVINGLWQYHSFCTWRVLRNSSIPYYVFPHGMLDPWFKRRYPMKHLKKLMYWPWAEYRVLRDANAVLFTGEEERRLAADSFALYRAREIVVKFGVTAPPVDLVEQRQRFLTRFPDLQGKRVLLFLGRIHPKKGLDLLIEAFSHVARIQPSLRLVIAGPDEIGLQHDLIELSKRLDVDSAIIWTGMLCGEMKMGALAAAEAFVLPSHQENFGVAVAEALACKVPVLISDKVNIWREILDSNAGLVAEDSLAGTTRLLQDWLNISENGRARIAANAYSCFINCFDSDAAALSVLEAIDQDGGRRRVA